MEHDFEEDFGGYNFHVPDYLFFTMVDVLGLEDVVELIIAGFSYVSCKW